MIKVRFQLDHGLNIRLLISVIKLLTRCYVKINETLS